MPIVQSHSIQGKTWYGWANIESNFFSYILLSKLEKQLLIISDYDFHRWIWDSGVQRLPEDDGGGVPPLVIEALIDDDCDGLGAFA